MGNETDAIREVLRQTPAYLTHVIVDRRLLEDLLTFVDDLSRRVQKLENERKHK